MKETIRPAIFKWRQTEPELILCAVRWYLRYSLSFRDVEELLSERGLEADHTTIWRWVQRYGSELEARLRRHLKPTNKSWRVDETYVRVALHVLIVPCTSDNPHREEESTIKVVIVLYVNAIVPHTRRAYAHPEGRFLAWCEDQGIELRQVTPGLDHFLPHYLAQGRGAEASE